MMIAFKSKKRWFAIFNRKKETDKNIWIIGGGMGDPTLLTCESRKAIMACDVVFTTERMSESLGPIFNHVTAAPVSDMAKLVAESTFYDVGILVSGDPGFYSIAKKLIEELDGYGKIRIICGISSLQYFCAKIGQPYEELKIISLHGRQKSLLGPVSYHKKVFCLTGGKGGCNDILDKLCENGLGDVLVTVGQDFSQSSEHVMTAQARYLQKKDFSDLAVMLIENEHTADRSTPLSDDDFIRGDTPMTKEEVRALSVYKLAPCDEDIIFDIGAGTGSVSVELARRACDGLVYAIERDEDAKNLIYENMKKFGTHNIIPVLGSATEVLLDLPVPNKAFIGGSGKNLREILNLLLKKNPEIRIVINAVTLQTLHEATMLLNEAGLAADIVCVQSSRAKRLGGYDLMVANNPVYIITGEKDGKEG